MLADSLQPRRSLARWWLFALTLLSIVFAIWKSEFGFHPQYEVMVDVTADGKAVVAYAVRRMASVLQVPFNLLGGHSAFSSGVRVRERLLTLHPQTGELAGVLRDESFEVHYPRQPSLDCADRSGVLAVCTPHDHVAVYDSAAGNKLHESIHGANVEGSRRRVSLGASGSYLVRSGFRLGPVLLDLSKSPVVTLAAPNEHEFRATLSPDDKFVVLLGGSGVGIASVGWALETLRLGMPVPSNPVDVRFTRDGSFLVALHMQDLAVWDAASLTSADTSPRPPPAQWEELFKNRPNSHYPLAHAEYFGLSQVALCPNSAHVATIAHRGLTIHRLPGLEVEQEISRFDLTGIAFGPDPDTMVLGDKSGRVSLLEWRTGRVVWSRQAIEAPAVSFPVAAGALLCWCFVVVIVRADDRSKVRWSKMKASRRVAQTK